MKKTTISFLILVIIGVLCFTACSNNKETQIPKKQVITYYPIERYKDIPKEYKDTTKTYMDLYHVSFGEKMPKGKEIDYSALSEPEKDEFIAHTLMLQKMGFKAQRNIKIIEPKNRRKLIVQTSFGKMKSNDGRDESITDLNVLDVLPTFPGCNENDGKCFIDGVKNVFFKYYDKKIEKKLGLPKGQLTMILNFTVSNEGHIVYAFGNAPKKELLSELERVMSLLPKIKPAELNGEKVAVKYSIPITVLVD